MRAIPSIVLTLALLQLTVGCGKSENLTESQAGNARPNDPVAQVVYDFWEAVRTGNVANATVLLTPEAQKCISDKQYDFVPPASDTMRFQVGEVEIVEGDQAICDSIWTDIDSDGNTYHESMSLALRLVDEHWRIFGMAADMGPNQSPMVMNLEDPDDFFGPQETAAPSPSSTTPHQAMQPSQDPFRQ